MKRWMIIAAMAGGLGLLLPGARAEGLRLGQRETSAPIWPQWQARLAVVTAPVAPLTLWSALPEGSSSTLLVGDYFFARPGLGWWPPNGLLRASTGLVLSSRVGAGLRGPEAHSTSLPYLGLGYSGLSPKGGWSISADLGLVAQNRHGGALFGSQSFDSALRELRFTPVLQFGVRYSF